MILETSNNYYEVLEVPPDATHQEIRQAYLRLKLAYSKDSIALYTLVSKEDMDEILVKIEEAYQILSSEEKRREYDKNHSMINETESPFGGGASGKTRKSVDDRIVSIDRVPPMDKLSREEDLLVAPATDFSSAPVQNMGTSAPTETLSSGPSAAHAKPGTIGSPGLASPSFSSSNSANVRPSPISTPNAARANDAKTSSADAGIDPAVLEEIERETEFPGPFLRKVRENRRISIEEMADYTKVSKTYLMAIENEDYTKLPAATFVRGFVIQVSKKLRLPHDKVAAAYISRYRKACPDKS